MKDDILYTTTEAAEILNVSKAYLERDRWQGASIPFVKIGTRTVRYRQSDLQQYVRNSIEKTVQRQRRLARND